MGKRWVELLAFVYGLLLIYSSLIPFDFSASAPSQGRGDFLGVQITDTNLPDILSNFALYLPFGVLLRAVFARRRVGPVLSAMATLLMAAGISFAMELTQTLSVTRISSIADCVCNVLGTAIGVIAYTPKWALGRRMTRAVRVEWLEDAPAVHAFGWAVVTVMTALAPFDVTIDVSMIGRAVHNSYFVPFAKLRAIANGVGPLAGSSIENIAMLQLWQLRIDYVVDVLVFFILAVLLARRWRLRDVRAGTAALISISASTSVAVFTTVAGLFVMSVGFDATHLITRTLGGLAGAVMHPIVLAWLLPHRQRASAAVRHAFGRPLRVGIALCIAYIAARELSPFHFKGQDALSKMSSIEWLPLHAYSLAQLPQAAMDALHKSFRFITLGTLLALLWAMTSGQVNRWRRVSAGCCVAVGVAALEFVQCWLPGRVPALTDVLIAAAAVVVGVMFGEFLYTGVMRSAANETAEHDDRIIYNVELPPPSADSSSGRRRVRKRRRVTH